MKLRILLFFSCLTLFHFIGCNPLLAQGNPDKSRILERQVSITVQNASFDQVLDMLSKQCKCYFTYDALLIDGNRQITFSCNSLMLKNVLNTLLQNPAISYEVIKNQVIIHPLKVKIHPDSISLPKFLYLSGSIVDGSSKEVLSFASIGIKNEFIGAVSNESGVFNLKIPARFIDDTLKFTYMGYSSLELPIRDFPQSGTIELSEGLISLQEVIVRSKDPLLILRKARESITTNYRTEAYNYEAFYREAVKSNNRYSIYSEALIYGYKPPLNSVSNVDKVELQKARKFTNIQQTDTLMVKLRGGMEACFQLDIIHHLPEFLSPEGENLYTFHLNDIVVWYDEMVYVIGFKQQSNITEPLLEGQVYINTSNFAVLGAEFYFAPEKLSQSKNLFVVRKSLNTQVKPVSTKYFVRYVPINNTYFIQYIRGELSMSVKKRRHLFNRSYSTMMEMVYTGMDTMNVEKPLKKDLFQTNTIFSESEYVYDDEFWKQQNIIQPEENILEAFKKSGFQIQHNNGSND